MNESGMQIQNLQYVDDMVEKGPKENDHNK